MALSDVYNWLVHTLARMPIALVNCTSDLLIAPRLFPQASSS